MLFRNVLSVISVDRYISLVHNRYHRKMVINKLLLFTITLVILISFKWVTVEALDLLKFGNIYITMSGFIGAVLAVRVISNVALLKYFNNDFIFSGGCLFAINDHCSSYFMRIHAFNILDIYQRILSRFSLEIHEIYTTSSKCCTHFDDLLCK